MSISINTRSSIKNGVQAEMHEYFIIHIFDLSWYFFFFVFLLCYGIVNKENIISNVDQGMNDDETANGFGC